MGAPLALVLPTFVTGEKLSSSAPPVCLIGVSSGGSSLSYFLLMFELFCASFIIGSSKMPEGAIMLGDIGYGITWLFIPMELYACIEGCSEKDLSYKEGASMTDYYFLLSSIRLLAFGYMVWKIESDGLSSTA